MRWWRRHMRESERVIESGRAAQQELHAASTRLAALVDQLEAFVAAERERRQRERNPGRA